VLDMLVPHFVPGLLLIPNPKPKAGRVLSNLDISFLDLFGYVAGSILYMASSVMFMDTAEDDYLPTAPGNYTNILAALVFLIDALVCLLHSWLQYKLQSAFNYGSPSITTPSTKQERKIVPLENTNVAVELEALPTKALLYDALLYCGLLVLYDGLELGERRAEECFEIGEGEGEGWEGW